MRKYKIVIVENDEDERMFMKEGFDTVNLFEVLAMVENGNALLSWLKKNSTNLPDLILSDLNMPGKNGYDIIREINESSEYKHIPVVITSTSFTKTVMNECLTLGAQYYIVKPETFIEYSPFIRQLHQEIENLRLVKN